MVCYEIRLVLTYTICHYNSTTLQWKCAFPPFVTSFWVITDPGCVANLTHQESIFVRQWQCWSG